MLAGCVSITPSGQGHQDGDEVASAFGEGVVEDLAGGGDRCAGGQAVVEKGLQSVGQDVGGDPDVAPDLAEAAPPESQLTDHEEGPPLAHYR